MDNALLAIEKAGQQALNQSTTIEALEEVRVRFLGRKGEVTTCLRSLNEVPPAERPRLGELANRIKDSLQKICNDRLQVLKNEALEQRLRADKVDITLPGRMGHRGGIHPITRAMNEITTIFAGMGYRIAGGPEVESDYYNFEALNIPPDHPAREMHDTFYLPDDDSGRKRVLRTHTSPVQIHVMENQHPPFHVVAPGRVFRCDSDLTHTPMFHQVEGFSVDRHLHFGQLKGLLTAFLQRFFEHEDCAVRFRPSFFPFTEPSAEVDMGCLFCQGQGCRVCKQTGWLEVLGCGLIHPNVLDNGGIDRTQYNGFAFGMGVERLAMLKYGIDDLRLFFDNDLRFLNRYGS